MAKTYRIRCPRCGDVVNLAASGRCLQCSEPLNVDAPASISIYRMGNFYGAAAGFGIYINDQPYGAIGNRETLTFPLPYGEYKIHVVCGMNRKCNDPVIKLSESDTNVCLKVHMKPGFFQNSFILERVDSSTMPQN